MATRETPTDTIPTPPKRSDDRLEREVQVVRTHQSDQHHQVTGALLIASASLGGVILGFCLGFGLQAQRCPHQTVAPGFTVAVTGPARQQGFAGASSSDLPLLGVEFAVQQNSPKGVLVNGVVPGTAAEQMGLLAGDRIQQVGNNTITRSEELLRAVRQHQPGDTTSIRYCRGTTCSTKAVTLGELPANRFTRLHRLHRYGSMHDRRFPHRTR